MTWTLVSDDPEIQAAYEQMREAGESHMIADLLAHRKTPASRTDREFTLGHCNGNQFAGNPVAGNYYNRVAKEAGVSTTGKQYLGQLAKYPGDPRAWVSSRGDVAKICKENGWGCTGLVETKVVESEGAPDIDVADDILETRADDMIALDPGLKSKKAVLKEEIKEKIKPRWSK